MDLLTEILSVSGPPYDRVDEDPTFEVSALLTEMLQDDERQMADRTEMRKRAQQTIDRILRYIAAGGSLTLRPDDLRDIESDIGALLATGEGIETDLMRALLGLRTRVTALLEKREIALAEVD